ncbi:AMP-dependent synthetase/ligase [Natronomonas sp.]|uniref:AMP-dependent synthetase/ligase n=1 Tax=Natronomonas sp. TaxID=2184060 RepID=UPI002FC2C40F
MSWREAEREYTDEVIGETTIPRLFFDAVDRYGEATCQQYKGGIHDRALVDGGIVAPAPDGAYADLSYRDVADIVKRLAVGFREVGVAPEDRVSIYADTRMEWAQADLALMSAGAVVTTVYTESSVPQVEHLLDDPDSTGVVVENAELLSTLAAAEDATDIDFAVLLEAGPVETALEADLYTLDEVYEMGADVFESGMVESWVDDGEWTDLASLVYTSGTTGDPKGVELTHKNWRSCMNQVRKRIGPRPDKPEGVPVLEAGKTSLAFLPLAHAFERSNHFQSLGSGVTLAYAGSADTIAEDIELVKPELAAAVPRVYERIYNGIREQAGSSPLKKRIFEWSVGVAQEYDRADSPSAVQKAKLGIADRLVFSQVREALGGNIEMFISGGGSLSADLARLYRAMGITIVEGYGLTETAPGVSFNPPEDIHIGTMGPPLVDVEVRLDDEEVDESTKEEIDGEVGELLVKGPNVFEGYWNNPDATDEAFDGEWFRTGDIVTRDDDGYLIFVDRLKNLLVLDTGKNVAPEPIEDEFATSPRVDQIMVVGDNEKFIAAIVAPNFEALRDWADEEGIDLPEDPEDVIETDAARTWVDEEIDRVNERLAKNEQIKEFRLVAQEWTADNDLLTPSMKKKRRNIRSAFEEEIGSIYGREAAEAEATSD